MASISISYLLSLAAILLLGACSPDRGTEKQASSDAFPPEAAGIGAEAIEAVLARDAALGGARNHAPETGPIADAIRVYVEGLDAIDFSRCPPEFAAAFRRHREAWRASLPFFERFGDHRGEMHDVFEEIRATDDATRYELEGVEKRIWDTWAEVEAAMTTGAADG